MPLSDDDRALARRDTRLPGLALALDAEAAARRLGTGPLAPHYLRYKPGETCTAHFDDGGTGITLRAVTAERYAIYLERRQWRRPGAGVRFLDDLRTVALPARLGCGIRTARPLLDPDRAGDALRRLLGPGEHRLQLLRLKPGRRLVARIDRAGRPHALLKAVPPAAFPSLLAAAEAAAAGGGPAILAHDAEQGLLAQAWLPGETADPRTATPADFARIGAALAALQRRPPGSAAPRPHPATAALAALAPLLPALAQQAQSLAGALAAALPQDGPPAFCHGDFSADQVVLSGGAPRIIDWDRSGPGPALADAGSFLARLDADVLAGTLDAGRAEALGRAFLAGYAPALAAADVAPWRAAALAALACEPFRARRPAWGAATARLLGRAADLLGPAGTLPRALDRAGMQRAISQALGRPLRLEQPQLLRERPGRRALLAYRGHAPGGTRFEAYGKLRHKAPDQRTPALHRRLAAAGLTGEAGVPDVVAVLPAAHLWLQARVDGPTLTDLLSPGGALPPLAAAGRTLARLHAIPPADLRLPGLRRWTMEDEIAVLDDALARAAAARPDLAPRLAALLARHAARVRELPPAPVTGIHRDFYPDQVIAGPATTWIVDLDLFALGDPAIDIANFLAHLRELALRRWATTDALAPQETAFLAGYAALRPLPAGRLETLAALSLARHVWISMRTPGRAGLAEAILSAAATPAQLAPAAR